jgi:hypothetical protein
MAISSEHGISSYVTRGNTAEDFAKALKELLARNMESIAS